MQTLIQFYQFMMTNRRSIIVFLTVGTLSAIVNIGSFSILWNGLSINYQLATSIAYVLSVIFHFMANRSVTFKATGMDFSKQIRRYLVMIFINYMITLMIMRFIVEILILSPYIGIVSAIGVTVSISYLMSRLWVFQTESI